MVLNSLFAFYHRMLMAGILPFGAVFIELFFILTVSESAKFIWLDTLSPFIVERRKRQIFFRLFE